MKQIPAIIFSILFCQTAARADVRPDSLAGQSCPSPGRLIIQTWHDGWRVAAAPRRWQTTDWLRFSAIVGAGVILHQADVKIDQFWQNHQSKWLSAPAKIAREFGNEWLLVPAFGALYLAGYLDDHPQMCRVGRSGLRCLMISGTLTAGLKFLAQREGPPNPDLWNGPKIPFQGQSFPSGHATLAFATATVLAHEFQFSRNGKIAIYSLATATAWARLYEQSHWASDVLIGAAIGHFTTRALLKSERAVTKKVRLEPYFSANTAGLACSLRSIFSNP